jgi:hypothetical protein
MNIVNIEEIDVDLHFKFLTMWHFGILKIDIQHKAKNKWSIAIINKSNFKCTFKSAHFLQLHYCTTLDIENSTNI